MNNFALQAFLPNLTESQLDKLSPEQRETLSRAVKEVADKATRARAADVETPPVLGNPAVGVSLPVSEATRTARNDLIGHRVSASAMVVSDPVTGSGRGGILVPGDVITIGHVRNSKETWNHLVTSGRIVLDADLPDPGQD